MDEQIAKIVGLIEHAELLAKANLDVRRKLDEAVAGIDGAVERATRKALDERLAGLPGTLKGALTESLSGPSESILTASGRLEETVHHLGWKAALVAAAIAFSMVLGCVLVWWWLVPDGAVMQSLRAEHDQLVTENDHLSRGHALSTCGPQGLPCARVDTATPYGKHADYYILKTD